MCKAFASFSREKVFAAPANGPGMQRSTSPPPFQVRIGSDNAAAFFYLSRGSGQTNPVFYAESSFSECPSYDVKDSDGSWTRSLPITYRAHDDVVGGESASNVSAAFSLIMKIGARMK